MRLAYILSVFTLFSFSLKAAANPSKDINQAGKRPALFVENKGQITDQSGATRSDIDFVINLDGNPVFISSGKLQYQFISTTGEQRLIAPSNASSALFRYSRLDMTLTGADMHAKATREQAADYHENYLLPDGGTSGSIAHAFNKIVYRNIYPGVDWVLYADKNGLKYDFVLHPGADAGQIRLSYAGASSLRLTKEGDLEAITPMGTIREHAPVTLDAGTGAVIPSSFKLNSNIVSYQVKTPAKGCIIDPAVRVWGTYYGGAAADRSHQVVTDGANNVYMCGFTISATNIATTGAHQGTYTGFGTKGFLAKFNASGTRLWATYISGTAPLNSDETTLGIACDGADNVYITGYTSATAGIATPGAFRTQFAVNTSFTSSDAYLMKFNPAGTRIWGTYYGGAGGDIGKALAWDKAGCIYMAGQTSSDTGIATPGRHQSSVTSLSLDGFLVKWDTAGNRIWGTYYGGPANDDVLSVAFDEVNKSVYLGGTTYSASGISTPGSFQPVLLLPNSNNNDAFLAKLDTAGQRQWGTYYGGTDYDQGRDVVTDKDGNVYLTGSTSGGTNLVSPGAFKTLYTWFGPDAFLIKLNTNGVRLWSTAIAGAGSGTSGETLTTDDKGYVYLGGTTVGSAVQGTPGAWQTSGNSIGRDGYLFKMSPNGQRIWCTYYSAPGDDYLNGLAYQKSNNALFLCGEGTGAASVAQTYFGTPGSLQPTSTVNGNTEGYLARFTNDTAAYINLPFNDTLLCVGQTINVPYTADTFSTGNVFSIQLSDPGGYFYPASPIIGTTSTNTSGIVSCTIPAGTAPGYYRMRLLATAPAFTGESENPLPFLKISTPPSQPADATSNSPVCEGDTLKLFATHPASGLTYQWNGPTGYTSTAQNPARANALPAYSGDYIVKALNNGCASLPDTVTVVINPKPARPVASVNTPLCSGDTLFLSATSTIPGVSYTWQGPGSFTSILQSPVIPATNTSHSGRYRVSTVVNGCSSIPDTVTVQVDPALMPSVSVSANPGTTVSSGTLVTFTALPVNQGSTPLYEWRKNGTIVPGVTGNTYATSSLADNDQVRVQLTSSERCADPDTALSNIMTMRITSGVHTVAGNEGAFRLYPNPNAGDFTVESNWTANSPNEPVTLSVTDLSGREIHYETFLVHQKEWKHKLSLDPAVRSGAYLLRLSVGNKVMTKLVIVDR